MTKEKEHFYPSLPILLVDDEPAWMRSLTLTLREAAGLNNFIRCSDSREVFGILENQDVSMILLDLNMPHHSGEDLLSTISHDFPDIPIIILTGMNQVDTAVQCMRLGAFDYFVKTAEKERLLGGIQRALSMQELRGENARLKTLFLEDVLESPQAFHKIKTRSKKMRSVFQYCEAVAASSEPILVTGESGVGKELIAQAIHCIRCLHGPWVAVNVAGLDDNVFSDTLFGHIKGAFTGADHDRGGMIEEASGGVLFLDEIGDLSQASQVKLLRLLQEGEYFPLGSDTPKKLNAKLICATNQDLEKKQRSGGFRKDLFYRLNSHHVCVPPLRERLEDLPVLLEFFFEEAAGSMNKNVPAVPKELVMLLATYNFPGNIRELRAMVYDAISLHKSHKISLESFKQAIGVDRHEPAFSDGDCVDNETVVFNERMPTLEEAGQLMVSEAMRRAKGNQTLAASLLGISRQALSKRLKKQASA